MRKSHLWEEFEGRHLRIVKALRQERKSPRQAVGCEGPRLSARLDPK